ncbi:hypothetical protein HQ520_17500 [bacterium]|nr:hypothetical protein [bacterium]
MSVGMDARIRRENVLLFTFFCGMALFLAVAFSLSGMASTPAKYLVAVSVIGLFSLFPSHLYGENRLLFVVALVFFPVTLTLGGRDTLSSASLLILVMGFLYVLKFLLSGRGTFKHDRVLWGFALLAIAVQGVLHHRAFVLVQEGRHLVNFAGGIGLFLLVVNAPAYLRADRLRFAEKVIRVLIWMMALQMIVGILIYYSPGAGRLFRVFLERATAELGVTQTLEFTRMRTLVIRTEAIGEFGAMLCPLILYSVMEGKRKYWFAYALIGIGLLLSNSRSGIVLFGVGTVLMTLLYGFRLKWLEVAALGFALPIAALLLAVIKPEIYSEVVRRMILLSHNIAEGRNLVEVFNRSFVWYDAW